MQFFIRMAVLQYIGVEILGITSTIMSVIQTLSLTEFGFQTTVVYYLYIPLKENDYEKTNQILTILKRVYEVIGITFIGMTILTVPMLQYILKDVEITGTVIGYYLLMSANNVCSYFGGYKRALLFASQEEYISKTIDSIFDIGISITSILVILFLKNYMIVLMLHIAQTAGANIIIRRFCRKKYSYLKLEKFNKELFKTILVDVKNVFLGKMAGYVYGATDNLVISSLLGTIYVGYLSNYTVFTVAIKKIVNSIFNAMTPIIGNILIDSKKNAKGETNFRMYTYLRYFLASAIVIPWVLLADDMVKLLFGKQYILSSTVVILLAIDLYIHIIYSVCVEYINGSGKFKADKNISIIGALVNIVTSLYGVYKMGLEGVLIGTCISQIFFWLGRGTLVYLKIFKLNLKALLKYAFKNSIWIIEMIVLIIFMGYIKNILPIGNNMLSIIIFGGLCEVIIATFHIIFFHFSEEQRNLIKVLRMR